MLELYFRPMACSLASRIALTEAGIEARYHSVNLRTNTDRRGLLIGRWRRCAASVSEHRNMRPAIWRRRVTFP
jgi:hypothetical protein